MWCMELKICTSDKHHRYYKHTKFRQNLRGDPKFLVDLTWNDTIRRLHPGPLFITADHVSLILHRLTTSLLSILQTIWLDVRKYSTHSFRIGAATSAKDAGISDTHIQILGRWKSNAFKQYIRTPRSQLSKFSRCLASIGG